METFQRTVSDRGFNFGIFLLDLEKKQLGQLFSQLNKVNTRGIVLAGDIERDLVARIRGVGKFCVLMNNSLVNDRSIPQVNLDHLEGAYRAVRHLLDRGHARIGIIGGIEGSNVARIRLEGYGRALGEMGIGITAEYVMTFRVHGEGMNYETGFAHMRKLLQARPLPTAVFAVNDTTAIAAMSAVQESGLSIPGDISIIGFDDIEMARSVTPRLTTMSSHREEIARQGADLLVRLIRGETPKDLARLVLPEIVERESVKTLTG
jgi:DNA-binding LacI/PurR family transcriptional regulator